MDPRPAAHRASQGVLPSLTCSLGTCSECRLPGSVKPTHPPGPHCLIGGVLSVSLAAQGLGASRRGGGLPLLHRPLQGTCEMKQLWTGRWGRGEGPSPGGKHRLPRVGGCRPSSRAGGGCSQADSGPEGPCPVGRTPRDGRNSLLGPAVPTCPRAPGWHFVCVCGCCGLVGRCSASCSCYQRTPGSQLHSHCH